jgi:DNA-binding transcriptional MerR regulator
VADLSIGEVAARTGLSVHTLRFYERQGLLPFTVRRGADGRRRYREDEVQWMTVIMNLRASGMPLAGIRRYAELVRDGAGNEAERLDLLREHQARVAAQLVDLNSCMDLISHKVKIYEDIVATGD